MKVVIPLAGKGTRLRPHTLTLPKPLLKVAGKAVLDYVIEDVLTHLTVDQLIFITGHLKELVEDHVHEHYDVPAVFVEQEVQDGTAGAVNLARPYVDGPMLIIFVDTVFDADLSVIDRQTDADALIWAKEVEDYQRFGVIVTSGDGRMRKIVEKPSEPISRLANIGLYYVKNHELLFAGIDATLAAEKKLGEYFLTDAFQFMVDRDATILVREVEGWYDCGKPETLLTTNRHLLETGRSLRPTDLGDSMINDPVRIEEGVDLRESTLGPNVTIGAGSTIVRSQIENCIVGEGTTIEECMLRDSLVGSHVHLRRFRGSVSLGDHSEAVG